MTAATTGTVMFGLSPLCGGGAGGVGGGEAVLVGPGAGLAGDGSVVEGLGTPAESCEGGVEEGVGGAEGCMDVPPPPSNRVTSGSKICCATIS